MSTARKAPRKDIIREVSALIQQITGVQLGENQRIMVEGRLKRRMKEVGVETLDDYLSFLEADPQGESKALVSLLTTHYSYFFREHAHFDFFANGGLEKIIAAVRARGDKKIRVWSAACSRGQEVYSLSMLLKTHLPALAPDLSYEILGTDIDPESVEHARNGVYQHRELEPAPLRYTLGNWARGTSDIADFVKAKKSIREPVQFMNLNLFELPGALNGRKFDIIFCRNVLIYFNREQIGKVGHSLAQHLHTDGILCIGISETFNQLGIPLESVGPSIYRHPQGKTARLAPADLSPSHPAHTVTATRASVSDRALKTQASEPSAAGPANTAKKVIRVLCVDDSPSILTLLKRVLVPQYGFEVIDTAANGIEAAEKVKALKPDLITLDIHMPEQDGVTYLARNYRPGHPPVVVVSSVSRDDAGLALETLRLGAADYIEKPKLEQLTDRADEIRSKCFAAATLPEPPSPAGRDLSLQASFAKPMKITRPEEKLRIIVAKLGDQKKLEAMLSKLRGEQPATWVLFEGSGSPVELLATRVRGGNSQPAVTPDTQDAPTGEALFQNNRLVFCDLQSALKNTDFLRMTSNRTTGVVAISGVSDTGFFKLRGLVQRGFWVLNEAIPMKGAIARHPGRRVPWTSLAYHAEADFPQEGTSD